MADGIVPVLPLRINFLNYAHDFINRITLKEPFTLIDLGCGPYAIIAQLAKQLFGWKAVCIEHSERSRTAAERNVRKNGDDASITFSNESDTTLLPTFKSPAIGEKRAAPPHYVVMCNPPWFVGDDTENYEKETKGGEVQFVSRLLEEYKCSGNIKCIAFCILVGRKCNVKVILKMAKSYGASTMFHTMRQGTKTRYFIGWTFDTVTDSETEGKTKSKVKSEKVTIVKEKHLSGSFATLKHAIDPWMKSNRIDYKIILSRKWIYSDVLFP